MALFFFNHVVLLLYFCRILGLLKIQDIFFFFLNENCRSWFALKVRHNGMIWKKDLVFLLV